MITLSIGPQGNVKKVHCPKCGGRICDVDISEQIQLAKETEHCIIVKCNKCGNKINISIK
jgi:RNase P subunit RPR2